MALGHITAAAQKIKIGYWTSGVSLGSSVGARSKAGFSRKKASTSNT